MTDRPRHVSVFFAAAGVGTETVWRPAVDIYRSRTGAWLLKFELAGVRPEDVVIRVEGCRITVSGVRKDYLLEEGCSYYSMEIAYSRFERSVDLPCEVERAKWTMDHRDGILLVRLETQ